MIFDEQTFNQENYDKLFLQKQTQIQALFTDFKIPKIEAFKSDFKHYRQRAEFRIWHKDDDIFHIMFNPNAKNSESKLIRIEQFYPAAKIINLAMTALMSELKFNKSLRFKLFQIDYLSSLKNEILVTLIYHKKLDDAWILAAQELQKNLFEKHSLNVKIVGRSHKQKICLSDDFILETMNVNSKTLILKQIENSFTQPNAKIAQQMLNWIFTKSNELKDKFTNSDLLELYSGNSFFSLSLTDIFRKILNAEISKASTEAALFNIEQNGCKNLVALNAKSEDIAFLLSLKETKKVGGDSQNLENLENIEIIENIEISKKPMALRAKNSRILEELAKHNLNLEDYNFSSILVDPPRKGLDDLTLKEVQKFDYIFYISCNPETLKNNLTQLCKTHFIKDMAFFDQFPYTHHSEIGVILVKN